MNRITQTRASSSKKAHPVAVSRDELSRLTSREREVCLLIAGGNRNKEIGSRLRISESTVKAHLRAIFQKLGIEDRLRLAVFILAKNIRPQ